MSEDYYIFPSDFLQRVALAGEGIAYKSTVNRNVKLKMKSLLCWPCYIGYEDLPNGKFDESFVAKDMEDYLLTNFWESLANEDTTIKNITKYHVYIRGVMMESERDIYYRRYELAYTIHYSLRKVIR